MFQFYGRFVRPAAPLAVLALGMSMLAQSTAAAAPTPVDLGNAASFAVLAGAGITNTGPTTITGDTGTFPTAAETGFNGPAPDFVTFQGDGVDHADDAVTQSAKSALVTAFNDAAGRLPVVAHAVELGGDTLTPGVYGNGTFGLTGTLRLDFQNDVTASFIFTTASTLITAVNSRVVLINADANAACRITWKVGSSATFNTGTQFMGDVLVMADITANTGATFTGRLLARDGAVTLDTNTIDSDSCLSPSATTTTTSTTASSTTSSSTSTTSTSALTTSTTSAAAPPSSSRSTTATTVSGSALTTTPPLADSPVQLDTPSAATPPTTGVFAAAPPLRGGPGLPVPLPPVTDTPNGPWLPETGLTSSWIALVGVALVLGGAVLLAFQRRRV